MARPRGQTRPGREGVLEAAIVLFAERGFHGTSMRDVAAAAGMTVAGIYHHFSSKQEILRGLMVATMIDVLEATAAALDAAGSTPQDRLGALVEAWVLFHTQRQAEALIGASELRSLDDEGLVEVIALRDQQEARFREIVDAGVSTGVFATSFPTEAARAVINMGYSIASWWRAGGEATPEQMAERYRVLALGTVELVDPAGGAH